MNKLLVTAAGAALLSASGAALSAEETASMNVSAVVTAGCSAVTATDMDFGAQGASNTIDTATATITVTCDSGTTYTVALDNGVTSGGPTLRQMTETVTNATMDYDIFQPNNTTRWGSAGAELVTGTGNGAAQPLTANGRLDRGTGSTPGSYGDLITVTLTF